MQLLSSTVSLTRYLVEGELAEPFMETVRNGLKTHVIREIDNDPAQKSVGWTCSDRPYQPDFDKSEIVFGTSIVFSLRIDKKSIPAKVITKQVNMAIAKRLAETEREHLSKNEKSEIKDHVLHFLYTRVPATPNTYDVIWNYGTKDLWFFSNQKEANEELETLFSKSFRVSLIRIFPYTAAELAAGLSDAEIDQLHKVGPAAFNGGGHHA